VNPSPASFFDWPAIKAQLERQKKADLIQLIQELTAVSAEGQRYVQARYASKKHTFVRLTPYKEVIRDQFTFSDWNNTVSWNFVGVQKAVDDYLQSSQGDEVGVCELLVTALEAAMSFADSINLQADDFDSDVTALAERCVELLSDHPDLHRQYVPRLKKVRKMGNDLGYFALDEAFDNLSSRSE